MSNTIDRPTTTSTLDSDNRATPAVKSPFPPEITEHPGWKAIWRKLLTPRDEPAEQPARDGDA